MDQRRKLIPDIVTLRAFECAARHGSFTRAGVELNLTQSAVSRHIKDLEIQADMKLFERVRRRVVLSEAGRRFLPEVRKFLVHSDHLMARTLASAGGPSLSIASLPTFGARWLIPRLPDFLSAHPGVSVDIGSRSEPFDFDDEAFDIAIHYGKPIWARATCTFLCSEEVVPVAAPSLLGSRLRQPADLLKRLPLLHLATRPSLWSEWLEQNGLDVANPLRGNRFDQFSMIIEAAVSGAGVALLPLYLIEAEIEAKKLVIVLKRPIKTENGYYVVRPDDKRSNALVSEFQSWLLTQVGRKKK